DTRWQRTPVKTSRPVQVSAESRRAGQLFVRALFDLTHALSRQVEPIANLLQLVLLVVFEAEAQADDFALLAVEIRQRAGELVEIRLMDHLFVDADFVERQELGQLPLAVAAAGAADRIAQRDVVRGVVERGE